MWISESQIANNYELDDITAEEVKKRCELIDVYNEHQAIRARDGIAQVKVTKDKIVLSNKGRGICVDEHKTTIVGASHIGANPSDIQIAGYWEFNDELLTCLPSTAFTPISVLKFRVPKYAEDIKSLAEIKSLLK